MVSATRVAFALLLASFLQAFAPDALAQTPGGAYEWSACWPTNSNTATSCASNGPANCSPSGSGYVCSYSGGQNATCGFATGTFDCAGSNSQVFCYTPTYPPPAGDVQYGQNARVCYQVAPNLGIAVSPNPANFGEQLVGTTSSTFSVTDLPPSLVRV